LEGSQSGNPETQVVLDGVELGEQKVVDSLILELKRRFGARNIGHIASAKAAVSQWQDRPDEMHERYPELEAFLSAKEFISSTNEQRLMQGMQKDIILQDLEQLCADQSAIGHVFSHFILAQECEDSNNWVDAKQHYEQIASVVNNQKYTNSQKSIEARAWILQIIGYAAEEAHEYPAAFSALRESYSLVKSIDLTNVTRLILYNILRSFISISWDDQSILSDFSLFSIEIEFLSVLYDPKTFGPDNYRELHHLELGETCGRDLAQLLSKIERLKNGGISRRL